MKGQISNLSQVAYIRRYILSDGKEEGIRVVEVNNGNIRFMLNESKALDIMQLWHKGDNISFISKNGFTKRETLFSGRFEGGMLYTVGLDSAGEREGFETHGSFHNIPAKIISLICNDEKIEVVAEIEDTALFGRNLKIERKIVTEINGDTITLHDTVINNGTKDENFCVLYHVNVGYPMLDEGVEVLYDGQTVVPRTALAKERIGEIHGFLKPVDNQEERCYFIENREPLFKVVNKKINKTFTLKYSKDTLPKTVLWQSNATGDYALGLEPTTTFLDDKFAYSVLEKGKNKQFKIAISVYNSTENK